MLEKMVRFRSEVLKPVKTQENHTFSTENLLKDTGY